MKLILPFVFFITVIFCNAKEYQKGELNADRNAMKVHFYKLIIEPNIQTKTLKGEVIVNYIANNNHQKILLDLDSRYTIDEVVSEGKTLKFERITNAFYVFFNSEILTGANIKVKIKYHGTPENSKNPPWTPGFAWKTDSLGNPWVGVTCEGYGASTWWPCKDHSAEEPDSVELTVKSPEKLQGISNGRLISSINKDGFLINTWKVTQPINLYNVTFYIGDYVHFSDSYVGVEGNLSLDYYVLKSNLEKAKKHFEQVKPMMQIFEKRFGAYPYYKDGYKLVESPYWGMEHQSAVAYGNNYKSGIYDYDFIIIHESGHEWFGNSVSCSDHADLWIHETFTTYMESVFVEEVYGKEKMQEYLNKQRKRILLKNAMLAPYNENYNNHDVDVYFKGTWMLHTLRNWINNDSTWTVLMHDFYQKFKYTNSNTKDVLSFFTQNIPLNIGSFFEEYLNYPSIPNLTIQVKEKRNTIILKYKWESKSKDFHLPIDIALKNRQLRLYPSQQFKKYRSNKEDFIGSQIQKDKFLGTIKIQQKATILH